MATMPPFNWCWAASLSPDSKSRPLRAQMPGTFGFSSDPGGRIACVHRSTIMRPEVEPCVGLSFLPLRFRFFVGCFLVGPSEVQSVSATTSNMHGARREPPHDSVTIRSALK